MKFLLALWTSSWNHHRLLIHVIRQVYLAYIYPVLFDVRLLHNIGIWSVTSKVYFLRSNMSTSSGELFMYVSRRLQGGVVWFYVRDYHWSRVLSRIHEWRLSFNPKLLLLGAYYFKFYWVWIEIELSIIFFIISYLDRTVFFRLKPLQFVISGMFHDLSCTILERIEV